MLAEIAKGSVWMIAARLAERSLGLISTLVLARLLMPDDFGLIAMAMSVIVTLELFSVFSFDVTLIQASAPERRHYDSAFTLNVLFRTGIALAMVLLARPAAGFYSEPRLEGVLYGLSVGWLAQAFENIAIVNFRREMRFNREFSFQTVKRVVSFVVTVSLALWFRSYWALVAGMVVGRVAGLIMSYAMLPYRPRFTLSAWRELMSFSVWLMLNNVLYVVATRISAFIVGRISGSHALGLYNMSREIGTLPTSELIIPIERALMAGYSRMAEDVAKLREGFLVVVSAVALFSLPAAFGVAAVAEPLVINLLSERWAEAVPLLQVLSFLGAVAAMASNTYPAYVSMGRPRIPTIFAIVRLSIMIPAMLLLVREMGAIGAAYAELGAALIMLPIGWLVLCRVLGLTLAAFSDRLWRPLASALLMFIIVREYLNVLTSGAPAQTALWGLISAILLGAVSYGVTLAALWFVSGRPQSIEVELLGRLQQRLRAR